MSKRSNAYSETSFFGEKRVFGHGEVSLASPLRGDGICFGAEEDVADCFVFDASVTPRAQRSIGAEVNRDER